MINFDNKENFEILDLREAEHPFDIVMSKVEEIEVWNWFCVWKEHQISPLVNMIGAQWFEILEEEQNDWSFKTYFLKV